MKEFEHRNKSSVRDSLNVIRKIELIEANDPKLVMNMFQYYIYDMSEYTKFSPNPDGTYQVEESLVQLSTYFEADDHYPYMIVVDGQVAGFSLLRVFPFDEEYYDIGQFFILRKYKGQGVGREAFRLSVKKHPGKWITRVLPNNEGAFKFWEKVIGEIAEDKPLVKKDLYCEKEMHYFYYQVNGG